MRWQALLIGKQARITPLGLAYDCPLHVGAAGTLHGITVGAYAPVYFCTVCHRSFSAAEMAVLLRVRAELPLEEPITRWLWRVRGSHPVPYWNGALLRPPLSKHAVSARALLQALGDLQAPPEQHRKLTRFLQGSARGAVVLVHTAGYDGVATSLTLARPNDGAHWIDLPLYAGITGFLPSVAAGAPAVFVPTVQMVIAPPIDLAEVGIAGSPRFTHADGRLSRAVDWKCPAACAVVRGSRSLLGAATVATVDMAARQPKRRPLFTSLITWMCVVAVAKAVGAHVRLRITLSSRIADRLIAQFGWYQETTEQLGLTILRDKHTRRTVTIAARHDSAGQELNLDLGSTIQKHMYVTAWPPRVSKLRKAISAATQHVLTKDAELPALLSSDPGEFLRRLVASLASDPRNYSSLKHRFTPLERTALLALSTPKTEPSKETPCAS